MARREYAGNAAATTINGAIDADDTEIQVADASNWPTGSPGPFVVIIDRGGAAEEKVLVTSRTDTTLFVNTRGFDSTTAASHSDGASIEHGLSATDIDEVNDHVFDTSNDDHTQYLNTTRHDVEARHTFTAGLGTPDAPENLGLTASAGSGDNPAREDHVHTVDDWDTWEPTTANLTVGDNGTLTARFTRIGDTVHFIFSFVLGSDSSMGTTPTFTLPVAPNAVYQSTSAPIGDGKAVDANGGDFRTQGSSISGSTYTIFYLNSSANHAGITASAPFTWVEGDSLILYGTYEAA